MGNANAGLTAEFESNQKHLTSLRRWMFVGLCAIGLVLHASPDVKLYELLYTASFAAVVLLLDFGVLRPRTVYLYAASTGVVDLFLADRSVAGYVWVAFASLLCAGLAWYFRKSPNGRRTDQGLRIFHGAEAIP